MHDTTVNNLKKLQEVISNSIKRSNECVQSCQDDSTPGNSYEAKIDLEELERITREFINDSGSISEKKNTRTRLCHSVTNGRTISKKLTKIRRKNL